MRISPTLVVIGKRHRKDPDIGIQELCRSIKRLGQLQPIVVVEGVGTTFNLVGGARRLRACELLDQDVDAVVADGLDDALKLIEAQRDENVCRMDFTVEEAVQLGLEIESIEGPKAKERQKAAGKKNGQNNGKNGLKHASGNLPEGRPGGESTAGETRDKAAEAAGMSPRTYDKARQVVEAAEADPAVRPLVDEMNATGKVEPAYTAFKAGTTTLPGKKPANSKPDKASLGGKWTIAVDVKRIQGMFDKLSNNWETKAECEIIRNLLRKLANDV